MIPGQHSLKLLVIICMIENRAGEVTVSTWTGKELMNEVFITARIWESTRRDRGHLETLSGDARAGRFCAALCAVAQGSTAGDGCASFLSFKDCGCLLCARRCGAGCDAPFRWGVKWDLLADSRPGAGACAVAHAEQRPLGSGKTRLLSRVCSQSWWANALRAGKERYKCWLLSSR